MIINRGISVPGHGREVVDGLNATEKRFILKLIFTVQLNGSQRFDKKMAMHTSKHNNDVSLSQELKKHLYYVSCKHGILNEGKYRKRLSKKKV